MTGPGGLGADAPESFADAWFLTGCTASGKSAVAIELAERLGAEILSVDSMAVYRRLDVGVAKATDEQRRRVAHHLIDLVEPEVDFSVANFLAEAASASQKIRSRGKVPLFVGGTPLYLKALLQGLEPGPPPNEPLRRELSDLAENQGRGAVHAELRRLDPVAAAALHERDLKRVMRAIEFFQATGRSIRAEQPHFHSTPAAGRTFVLLRDDAATVERIERRVEAMFAGGLIAEVEALLAEGRRLGATASQAIGYREALAVIAGEVSLDEAQATTKLRTRRLAKRQRTWFRGMPFLRTIPVAEGRDAESVAGLIIEAASEPNR